MESYVFPRIFTWGPENNIHSLKFMSFFFYYMIKTKKVKLWSPVKQSVNPFTSELKIMLKPIGLKVISRWQSQHIIKEKDKIEVKNEKVKAVEGTDE